MFAWSLLCRPFPKFRLETLFRRQTASGSQKHTCAVGCSSLFSFRLTVSSRDWWTRLALLAHSTTITTSLHYCHHIVLHIVFIYLDWAVSHSFKLIWSKCFFLSVVIVFTTTIIIIIIIIKIVLAEIVFTGSILNRVNPFMCV